MKLHDAVEIPEPKIARFLFADTRMGWVWLIVRVYVGWQWLIAGWEKITSPAWTGTSAGTVLQTYLINALSKAGGAHPDVSGWYASFLQHFVLPNAVVFSYLVMYGEFLVGIALIVGAFTGIAAAFGAFMNINYLFAGTLSVNPLLFLLEIALMFAWRNAGFWGLDRWFLRAFGVPWEPGTMFDKQSSIAGKVID